MDSEKMHKQKEKSLEQLERERIQAEIDKFNIERNEIEKRVNQKWYSEGKLWIQVIALLVAIAIVVAYAMTILVPLTQTYNELAEAKFKLAETKLELALFEQAKADSSLNEAIRRESLLRNQVKKITSRLDSVTSRHKAELKSTYVTLEKETTKSQTDQKRIDELESQIASLKTKIKRTETEKEQIERISDQSILSGRVLTRENGHKLPLEGVLVTIPDGSVRDTTDVYGNFKLEILRRTGPAVKLIFRKPGYLESSSNFKPPNFNIEQVLEKSN